MSGIILFSYYYLNIYSFRILNGLLVLNCYEAECYMEDQHLLDWKTTYDAGWVDYWFANTTNDSYALVYKC